MSNPELNVAISGDEARILMTALINSDVSAPMKDAIALFMRLNEISVNQPAKVTQ